MSIVYDYAHGCMVIVLTHIGIALSWSKVVKYIHNKKLMLDGVIIKQRYM